MPENTLTGAEREAAERARIDARLEATRQQLLDRRVAIEEFNGSIGADSRAFTARKGEPHPSGHAVVVKYPERFRAMTEDEIKSHLKCLKYQLGI